jgi:hypothetical protein
MSRLPHRIFTQQVVGFDDADAFGKVQHRFGEGLVLFLAVMGFPQRVFPQPVAKGQGGAFVRVEVEQSGMAWPTVSLSNRRRGTHGAYYANTVLLLRIFIKIFFEIFILRDTGKREKLFTDPQVIAGLAFPPCYNGVNDNGDGGTSFGYSKSEGASAGFEYGYATTSSVSEGTWIEGTVPAIPYKSYNYNMDFDWGLIAYPKKSLPCKIIFLLPTGLIFTIRTSCSRLCRECLPV